MLLVKLAAVGLLVNAQKVAVLGVRVPLAFGGFLELLECLPVSPEWTARTRPGASGQFYSRLSLTYYVQALLTVAPYRLELAD